MTKNNFILGDMSVIRGNGIKLLQDNYYWPVPDKEFTLFSEYMHDSYIELIRGITDEKLFNIAVVELTFISNLVQIFHYNYVCEFSKDNNINLLCGNDSKMYRNPDWHKLRYYYTDMEFPFGGVKRFIRKFIKNIIFNKHLSIVEIVKGFQQKDTSISIGSMDVFKMEFIQKKGIFFSHYDWIDFFKVKKIKNKKINNTDYDFIKKNVVDKFLSILESNNTLFIKNVNLKVIKDVWSDRFNDLLKLHENLHNFGDKIQILLVSDMAKPFNKVITTYFQNNNVSVFCFHHGNDACYSNQSLMHQATVSHCKNFVTPSNGIRDVYKKLYSNLPIEQRVGTKYISLNSSYYNNLFSKYSNCSKSSIKKIMVMGFPLNSFRYNVENNLFFYKTVDLEYRLISTLKKAGYHVTYKVHPDRLEEVDSIFNNMVDEYIVESFEKVWNKSDALIFTYTSTTTFGFALTTNLPIILIDSAKNNRNADEYRSMRGRVNILNAITDDSMRIIFDQDELLNMINKINNKNDSNFSYVDKIFGKK
jgi:hypothetical protein